MVTCLMFISDKINVKLMAGFQEEKSLIQICHSSRKVKIYIMWKSVFTFLQDDLYHHFKMKRIMKRIH